MRFCPTCPKMEHCRYKVAGNVEAMTSKGLRNDELSTDTKLDASLNAELTTTTFIGYSLCYAIGFYLTNLKTKI